jgi:hypothetical protein
MRRNMNNSKSGTKSNPKSTKTKGKQTTIPIGIEKCKRKTHR